MDAKNTCDGRRNDRSHMDYKGADDVQDAFSIIRVHDPDMHRSSLAAIRSLGFNVQDVRDLGMRYARDQEIIDYALNTGRIFLWTLPRDQGYI